MKKYYFSGVVRPDCALLNVSPWTVVEKNDDGQTTLQMMFRIDSNNVTAVVESDEPNTFTLRNKLQHWVEFVTSALGFVMGYGSTVEITKYFVDDPSLATVVLGIAIPGLVDRNKHADLAKAATAVFDLKNDPIQVFVHRCLTDLTLAIKSPSDTPFYLLRALDSLRQSFHEIKEEKSQWMKLAQIAGKSDDDTKKLRHFATNARHGVPLPLSDGERWEFFQLVWDIVEHFIDHHLERIGSQYRFRAEPDAPAHPV